MKITTTFWSKEIYEFNKILFINGNTKEVFFEVDLNNQFEVYNFFKKIAKFIKSPTVLKTIYSDDFFQFAVLYENEITYIKWFDLVINNDVTISHDIAFNTTLISKNSVRQPFGNFPMQKWEKNVRTPKYREFNIKAQAYKYIANQVKKNIFT